ncbi:MAG: 16S rRNA processing protein RimM [Bacteroidetes bacterium CG12_big_fil_rev_8_21_14_0_65_60_17]|nr:MAG: 16S rRNA processing protein RimM [Bacteroidetes bacterium CG12_big_fil_rev_8_21_14_0_65_60_17]
MAHQLRRIGRIVRPHGVRGEVKVAPETDRPEIYLDLQTVLVGSDNESAVSFDILSANVVPSRHGVTAIVQLDAVSSRDAAEQLAGQRVYARAEDLPELADDEFYYDDVIGLVVLDQDGSVLGTVKDILEAPAQDKLVVSRPGRPDVLIPLVPAFIGSITTEHVVINTIEGLID